jgi:hypothetical protein
MQNFEKAYSGIVASATQHGVLPETHCWKGYCSTSMYVQYSDGFAVAFRNVYDNGVETRNFCAGRNTDQNTRHCAWSTGLVIDNHFDGHGWQTTQTIAKVFDDEPTE